MTYVRPFRLADPETMAWVRQTLREEEEAERNNTAVAAPGPAGPTHDPDHAQENSAPGPSTAVPDTPNINATATHHRIGESEPHHLRLRNAIQREELRVTNRALREAHTELGELRNEALRHRERSLQYAAELAATRTWMQRSACAAAFLGVCGVLYTVWCTVNSAEFEFQRRVVRRNLGLE